MWGQVASQSVHLIPTQVIHGRSCLDPSKIFDIAPRALHQLPGATQMPDLSEAEDFEVVEAHWHNRKLRIGAHVGNRFDIRVSNIAGDVAYCQQQIKETGKLNG